LRRGGMADTCTTYTVRPSELLGSTQKHSFYYWMGYNASGTAFLLDCRTLLALPDVVDDGRIYEGGAGDCRLPPYGTVVRNRSVDMTIKITYLPATGYPPNGVRGRHCITSQNRKTAWWVTPSPESSIIPCVRPESIWRK